MKDGVFSALGYKASSICRGNEAGKLTVKSLVPTLRLHRPGCRGRVEGLPGPNSGGGSFLDFLGGKELPGIAAIEDTDR